MGQNRQIVDSFFAAMQARNFSAIPALLTSGTVFRFPDGVEARGKDAVVEVAKQWTTAFPNLSVSIVESVEQGNDLACRVHLTGTHNGPLATPDGQSIPATGKSVEMWPIDWIRFDGGLIDEWIINFDQLGMLTQLGLVPEPATA